VVTVAAIGTAMAAVGTPMAPIATANPTAKVPLKFPIIEFSFATCLADQRGHFPFP
jgi:hypothetical protein